MIDEGFENKVKVNSIMPLQVNSKIVMTFAINVVVWKGKISIQTEAKWKVEVTVELPYSYDFINFLNYNHYYVTTFSYCLKSRMINKSTNN